ncbi:MAG: outer membrane beta-barrel protein [Candidatus Krumholzibacteriota bacterium]|nr:outer membrane beta-barrel protein [Candidatus Krumholzibacteriota bacterium]
MSRPRALPAILCLALLAGGLPAATGARADDAAGLAIPGDPLRITIGLGLGVHTVEDRDYEDFFEDETLRAWTLRLDYRVLGPLRLGAAVTALGKSHRRREISLDSDAYPIVYRYSAFTGMGELFLTCNLPGLGRLQPYASAGLVLSRLHAESTGYSEGYDATWDEYHPVPDLKQNATGWRLGGGVQTHVWANVFAYAEGGRLRMDPYDEPTNLDPPAGLWSHTGWRFEAGVLQRW